MEHVVSCSLSADSTFFIILFILHFQNSNAQTGSVHETNYQKVENAEHIVVYYEEGKFLGWPANNGAWSADGVNMLVGFTHGDYELKKNDHNIGGNQLSWLARSTNMGQTWKGYDPVDYVGDFGRNPELLSLENPVMKVQQTKSMLTIIQGFP